MSSKLWDRSHGTFLKEESHSVCITLKRSQEEQTGMRDRVNHQETGGLKRRSKQEGGGGRQEGEGGRCSDALIFS